MESPLTRPMSRRKMWWIDVTYQESKSMDRVGIVFGLLVAVLACIWLLFGSATPRRLTQGEAARARGAVTCDSGCVESHRFRLPDGVYEDWQGYEFEDEHAMSVVYAPPLLVDGEYAATVPGCPQRVVCTLREFMDHQCESDYPYSLKRGKEPAGESEPNGQWCVAVCKG